MLVVCLFAQRHHEAEVEGERQLLMQHASMQPGRQCSKASQRLYAKGGGRNRERKNELLAKPRGPEDKRGAGETGPASTTAAASAAQATSRDKASSVLKRYEAARDAGGQARSEARGKQDANGRWQPPAAATLGSFHGCSTSEDGAHLIEDPLTEDEDQHEDAHMDGGNVEIEEKTSQPAGRADSEEGQGSGEAEEIREGVQPGLGQGGMNGAEHEKSDADALIAEEIEPVAAISISPQSGPKSAGPSPKPLLASVSPTEEWGSRILGGAGHSGFSLSAGGSVQSASGYAWFLIDTFPIFSMQSLKPTPAQDHITVRSWHTHTEHYRDRTIDLFSF